MFENWAAQPEESVSLKELRSDGADHDEVAPQTRALEQNGLATLHEEGNKIPFTPAAGNRPARSATIGSGATRPTPPTSRRPRAR